MEKHRYFLILFSIVFFFSSCQQKQKSPASPNILILFTDDQRFNTLHSIGNEDIRTPNLDRLAAEGVTFIRAHIMGGKSGAICVPSRAMLNTGLYVHSLVGAGGVIPEEQPTMPETFRKSGYATFFTGKWHNDKLSFVRSFTDGGNIYFGGMHFPKDGGHFAPWLHHFDSTGRYPEEDKWQAEKFSSVMYADAAVDFLRQQKGKKQPFYACVAFTSPHDPRTPPASYEALYDPGAIPLPANYKPEHPFDNGELKNRDENLLPWPRTEETIQRELALYYGMISEVDAQIGRILNALEESGEKENTLIVYAGDNGLAVGSHGLLGKQNLYEHSIRIPMIIAGPGIPSKERRESFVYLSDIFPTLAQLSGIPAPASVEGQNIVPVIEKDEAVRDNVFYIYRDLQRGVRSNDNWKLIKYLVKGEITTQLFNLNEDPDEIDNLAEDPTYSAKLVEMEGLLKSEMKKYKDDLDPEQPYFGKQIPKARTIEAPHLGMRASLTYKMPYSAKYNAGGQQGLIDGQFGLAEDFTYNWQGFEGEDLEIVIDLGKELPVKTITTSFLQAQGAWIFLPERIEYALSKNNKDFRTVAQFTNPSDPQKGEADIKEFEFQLEDTSARYLKVTGKNIGACPEWHNGAGGKAWIFVDEIVVQ